MKFLAMEVERAGAAPGEFEPHLRDEAKHLWDLQQRGVVREAYFRADQHTAVLVLECESLAAAREVTGALPLAARGLIHFDVIPLASYPGYARLFA